MILPSVCVGFLCCLQLLLECPDDIFAFEFCPSDPNIIVGGCINGQVLTLALLCISLLLHLLPSLPCISFFYNLPLSHAPLFFIIREHYNKPSVILIISCTVPMYCFCFHSVLINTLSYRFVLLLSQVVLWDISAHVTRLQGTQPGKKVSVNTDACVSTHVLSLMCTMLIQ